MLALVYKVLVVILLKIGEMKTNILIVLLIYLQIDMIIVSVTFIKIKCRVNHLKYSYNLGG